MLKIKALVACSECGLILGEDRLEDLPIGATFALKVDAFKENRAFCGQKEFETFYLKHPEESFDPR